MGTKYVLLPCLLFGSAFGAVTLAQSPPADPLMSAAAKAEVIQALRRKLQSNYVFPEVAERRTVVR